MHTASSGNPFDREILAELSVDEGGPLQLLLPVAVRFDLVDVDRALLTPVAGQVALPVSVEIQPADAAAARHRILPDRGVHRATLPGDVARESDVYRQQSSHVALRLVGAVQGCLRGSASATVRSRSGPCGITV
jgi:hypothetical protein